MKTGLGAGLAGITAGFAEDLSQLTRQAAEVASTTCRGCASYHGSWPALRLAGAVGGVDRDRERLIPIFARIATEQGSGDWLIAGAADSGLLATVVAALERQLDRFRITVVDRCRTPLLLCEDYARRTGAKVSVAESELSAFSPLAPQRLVFAHSVLGHLEYSERRTLIGSFRDWLAPGGRLVLVSSTGGERERRSAPRVGIDDVIAACKAAGVDDQATLDRIVAWRPEWEAQRAHRMAAIPVEREIESLCRDGGFDEIECINLEGVVARRPHEIIVARAPS